MEEKNRNKHNVILVIILVCMLWICASNQVFATNVAKDGSVNVPQAVKEKESAAVKLLVYVVDDNNKKYNVRQGTGILVGTQDNAGQTSEIVLTNDKLIRLDDTDLNNIRLKHGISQEMGLDIHIDVVLQVGTRIQAEAKYSGEGFVVLSLTTDISEIECMNLGDSASVNLNDKLYMLGYGGNRDILGQETLTNLELESAAGVVTSVTEDVIVTDYQPQTGNVGMPVLNANGYVVGMYVEEESGLSIKPIDSIKKALDVLSISYVGIEKDNHYNEVTEEISQELDSLLYECQELAMDTDAYSEKSIGKLKEAITVAMEVKANVNATYDQYVSAIEGLQKYKKKLKAKDHSVRTVQIGLAGAILFFIILSFRTQQKINQLQEENKYNLGGLVGNNDVIYAKLIRMDTRQEIPISNVIFRIGKSAEDVDYVIDSNSSISRHHADIMRKGKEFYILDNNSTNHTFVNGEQIISGQYVPIKAGDIIQLSDMEFLFEI